jgi:hypothetical protein
VFGTLNMALTKHESLDRTAERLDIRPTDEIRMKEFVKWGVGLNSSVTEMPGESDS